MSTAQGGEEGDDPPEPSESYSWPPPLGKSLYPPPNPCAI